MSKHFIVRWKLSLLEAVLLAAALTLFTSALDINNSNENFTGEWPVAG
jgi:hypothetical protein